MAFINKILGKLLGNKADKDMVEITPILERTIKEYERIKLLSSDELRAESARLKAIIQERGRNDNTIAREHTVVKLGITKTINNIVVSQNNTICKSGIRTI